MWDLATRFEREEDCSSSKRPAPHSLRHAFVVRRINAWAEQGIDIASMLPYLSGYLGHAGPEETYYYYYQTIDAIRLVRDVDRVCALGWLRSMGLGWVVGDVGVDRLGGLGHEDARAELP